MGSFTGNIYNLPGGFCIYVRMPNEVKHGFDVEYDWTVKQVKDKVSIKIGLFADAFDLYNGQEVLNTSRTLCECDIAPGFILMFVYHVKQISIILKLKDVPKSLIVPSNEKVAEIRKTAIKLLSMKKFDLCFNSTVLSDQKRLDEVGVGNNSELHVVINLHGGI